MRTLFTNRYDVWTVVFLLWFVFTVCAQVFNVKGWSLLAQISFVVLAVVLHSTVLAVLCSVLLHRVGTFSVVFFFYLLTGKAIWSLRPCPRGDCGASVLLLVALAIVLVCAIVVPVHTSYTRLFEYPYPTWATYLEPPLPVWKSYTGALVATLQMIWVVGLYSSLTQTNEQSQSWYFVGRMYLVVVYGWQLLWYFMATRGCRRSCIQGSDLPCVSG